MAWTHVSVIWSHTRSTWAPLSVTIRDSGGLEEGTLPNVALLAVDLGLPRC